MRKMCVISKKGLHLLFTIGLCCVWSVTGVAQNQSDFQRLEKKIDSVLVLLQKEGDQVPVKDSLKKDCTEEIVLLENKSRQEFDKLQSELQSANLNADKLKQENTEHLNKIEQYNAQVQKEIEAVLNQIMLGGTGMGSEGINYFLELAKKYKAANTQKIEAFALVFKEVIQLEQEFSQMKDYEKLTEFAWSMHSKTYGYPGLHSAVHNILFKLKNYCDYEQKLMDAIALSQTQISEENRKKQLLRREDDFTDYPYLKAEMEKVKANKDYKPTPKCN